MTTPPHDYDDADFDMVEKMVARGMIPEAKILEENILRKNPSKKFKIISLPTGIELLNFITQDEKMVVIKKQIGKLSNFDDAVLISGPTGTGKEILARALHGRKENIKAKFIAVNCTSLPDELLESELFGHKKGAFTGAIEDRIGKFQYAQGGTILLDEIGDMKPNMQAKLLRVLQSKRVTRVGDNLESDELTFRLVCSTNKDLKKMVSEGLFREDLYERVCTFEVTTSPLVERLGDCPLLATHYSNKVEVRNESFPVDFDWAKYSVKSSGIRGNVREIQRLVRRFEVLEEVPDLGYKEEYLANPEKYIEKQSD